MVYGNKPVFDGISGAEPLIADLIDQARDTVKGENVTRLDILLSRVILDAAPNTTRASLEMMYGDTYHLQREVIEDAHALTAVIDACGKSGHGDIGATLCMRSTHYLDQAWEIARLHRMNVIDAIKGLPAIEGQPGVDEVHDATLTSDVADILARDREHTRPVLVYANPGDACKILHGTGWCQSRTRTAGEFTCSSMRWQRWRTHPEGRGTIPAIK